MTWNHLNTFQWFRERVYKLDETGWDTSDKVRAFELSLSTFHDLLCTPDDCRVPIGVYYQESGRPTYEDGVRASQQPGWKCAEQPRDISGLVATLG